MNKKFLEFDSTYTFQISRKSDKKYFHLYENMFYLPHPTPFGPQTPNVSESVVALFEDSFPAKKNRFFGHLGRLKPGGPLNAQLDSQVLFD